MLVKIMSGLPGSGKSTFVTHLLTAYLKAGAKVAVASADDFHMVEGRYVYNRSKAGEAHDWCLRTYVEHLYQRTMDLLIVDNTNTNAMEIAPYIRIAQALGHRVQVVRFIVEPLVALARNTHEVPFRTIMEMQSRLLEPLPSQWPAVYIAPPSNTEELNALAESMLSA